MPRPPKPLCLGIAGGSGSGKSWLAAFLKDRLGERAVIVCADWYYRDRADLSAKQSLRLNFDHPKAIEIPLLKAQLGEILRGRHVLAPRYEYVRHARLQRAVRVLPAPLVILEGLLILNEPGLRSLMDFSVYIEVPDDVRLLRRIRRDVKERRVDLDETLRLYESFVAPMHERFVQPSSTHATWVWRQTEDPRFPKDLLRTLEARLNSAAG